MDSNKVHGREAIEKAIEPTVTKKEEIITKEGELKKEAVLRTLTEEEKNFKELIHNTVGALEDSMRAIGKMYITMSISKMVNQLGLDNTLPLIDVVRQANEKKILFQENGLVNMLGLNIVATFINKLPLVDLNGNTFLCICGKKHVIRKTKRGKSCKCDLFMKEAVYAMSWTRLSIIFYSEVLRFILRKHDIKPHVQFIV
jgi:hypothetical protein